MNLIVQLLLVHVIGDFVLQPARWVEDKRNNTFRSKFLYMHVLVHALAFAVIFRFDTTYWLAFTVTIVSHYLIDLGKLILTGKANETFLFFADQALHLLMVTVIAKYYLGDLSQILDLTDLISQLPALILVLLCVTFVSSIMIRVIMKRWEMDEDTRTGSLEQAGNYIGMLERLFIFVFLVMGQWAAIGLLITAKSVFRFNDLSRARDRKLTEYVLIGTLLSFALAVAFTLLYLMFTGGLSRLQ